MAWTCTGRTNVELIDNLIDSIIVQPGRVAQAMKSTDRKHYVPDATTAYQDSPQSIGFGATISAPHMHAYALEALEGYLQPGDRCLDVGCGSGYLTAVISRLVGPDGLVVGIDHLEGLTRMTEVNLGKDGIRPLGPDEDARRDNDDSNTSVGGNRKGVKVVLGDGRLGFPLSAPYKAIHVGAASPVIPSALLSQLASPGMMFIPVGTDQQVIKLVSKDEQGNVRVENLMGVRYIPLTDARKQWTA